MEKDRFFKEDIFKNYKGDIPSLEDNIYKQFAKTLARNIDVDFAKTPVVDFFTGYMNYFKIKEKIKEKINLLNEEGEKHGDDWGYIECRVKLLKELLEED